MATHENIGIFDTFPVEFGRDGSILNDTQVTTLLGALGGATDLLVISHGWNNNEDEASDLYRELLGNLSQLTEAPPGDARRMIVLRVYWPSKRFADEDLIRGGAAGLNPPAPDPRTSIGSQIDLLLEDYKNTDINGSLGDPEVVKLRALTALKALLPRLEADDGAQEDFVRLARALMSAHVNDEEEVLQDSFFNSDGNELLQKLARRFHPPINNAGGAAALGAAGQFVQRGIQRRAQPAQPFYLLRDEGARRHCGQHRPAGGIAARARARA